MPVGNTLRTVVIMESGYVMICNAKDLSPEQKAVIEGLLGRRVLETESISVQAIEPPALSDEERKALVRDLQACFANVDAQRQPLSSEEADAVIDEALRSTRPHYRPVR